MLMRKLNTLHLVKLPNCNTYLVKYDRGRAVSAAVITSEVYEQLIDLQLRYETENQAWRIVQPHENDAYRSSWSQEMVNIACNIRRHNALGQSVQRRMGSHSAKITELSVGGCRVAAESYKEYGWPMWFNQEEFNQAVATLS